MSSGFQLVGIDHERFQSLFALSDDPDQLAELSARRCIATESPGYPCRIPYALYIPWSAKRNYRQYKALSTPVSMEIRADGLYFKQQNGEGLVPWSHVHKWRHNKKMLLLYPTGNVFHLVPSHFFPSQESFGTFVATVKEHVGNAS